MGYSSDLIYSKLTYKINGALFTAHNLLGPYCNEKQYADAIEEELKSQQIVYEREKVLPQSFQGEHIGRNEIDFLIEGKVILEIKVKRIIARDDYYQIKRYLRALNKKLGILVNFRSKYIRPKRILNSQVTE